MILLSNDKNAYISFGERIAHRKSIPQEKVIEVINELRANCTPEEQKSVLAHEVWPIRNPNGGPDWNGILLSNSIDSTVVSDLAKKHDLEVCMDDEFTRPTSLNGD
jgi:hypothetical protein